MENQNPRSFDNYLSPAAPMHPNESVDPVAEIRIQYEMELAEVKEAHQNWMKEQHLQHQQQLRQLEVEANNKFHEIQNEHRQQMEQMREKYDENFQRLIDSNNTQMRILADQHQQQLATAKDSMAKLELELKSIKDEHEKLHGKLTVEKDQVQEAYTKLQQENKSLQKKLQGVTVENTQQEALISTLQEQIKNFSATGPMKPSPVTIDQEHPCKPADSNMETQSSFASAQTAPNQWETDSLPEEEEEEEDEEHT
ncbi:hypothetical protein G6F16_013395 [Rhizopus arrhizus]|nr:hypothetical protein G6F16_013395 [Rhizopus arrhizus]